MYAALLPFLIGVSVGVLIAWVASWLLATAHAHHHPARAREHLTVQKITARIERERRQVAEGTTAWRRMPPAIPPLPSNAIGLR